MGGHGTVPEDLIGHIDPSSAKAVGSDVIASGWVDPFDATRPAGVAADQRRHARFQFPLRDPEKQQARGRAHPRRDRRVRDQRKSTPVKSATRVLAYKGDVPALTVAALARRIEISIAPARRSARSNVRRKTKRRGGP